jgi:hypothetical protein
LRAPKRDESFARTVVGRGNVGRHGRIQALTREPIVDEVLPSLGAGVGAGELRAKTESVPRTTRRTATRFICMAPTRTDGMELLAPAPVGWFTGEDAPVFGTISSLP